LKALGIGVPGAFIILKQPSKMGTHEILTDPIAVVRVPFAVTVRILTVAADQGIRELSIMLPSPADPAHMKAAGGAVANRAVVALGKRGITVLAFFGLIFFTNMTIRNRHASILRCATYRTSVRMVGL
jgi:hypothetical protein